MGGKPVIHLKDIVDDIRSGCSDSDIMTKYRLSSKGLRSAVGKLIKLQALDPLEIEGWCLEYLDRQSLESMYTAAVVPSEMLIRAYDKTNLQRKGRVMELSEKGMRVSGIDCAVGEKLLFIVIAEDFVEIEPIEVEAKCHWCRPDSDGEVLAGFEFKRISPESRDELATLLKLQAG